MVATVTVLALQFLTAAEGPTESVTEQVIVLRSPVSTRADLEHLRGDRVATLTVSEPPDGLLAALRAQLGVHVIGASRLDYEAGTLSVRLGLSSSSLKLSLDRVPNAWVIRVRPFDQDDVPSKVRLFGRVPGLVRTPPLPTAVPAEPGDAPCPGQVARTLLQWASPAARVEERFDQVQDPQCADHLAASLALEAMEKEWPLKPFERWAFNFDARQPWRGRPRAFARIVLIAAEILTRTGYLPEAEVLLTRGDAFRLQSARPYQALALANLAYVRKAYDDVDLLTGAILPTNPDERLVMGVGVLSSLALLARNRAEEALAAASITRERIANPATQPGHLYAFAGEIALALGQLDRAESLYRAALEGMPGPTQAQARLRLVDVAGRSGDLLLARRRLARASGSGACMTAHLRLRSVLLGTDSVAKIQRTLEQAVDRPACDSELRMANYMLARLYLDIGVAHRAVPLALRMQSLAPPLLRNQTFVASVRREVLGSALARLERHARWSEIARIYESDLKQDDLLDPVASLVVARAYQAMDLHPKAADLLKQLISTVGDADLRERTAYLLIRSYLEMEDDYRASLVLRYVESQFVDRPRFWQAELMRAQLEMLLDRDEEALEIVRQTQVPSGDPETRRRWIEGRALAELGRISQANRAFTSALEMPQEPPVEAQDLLVAHLSEAFRAGSPDAGPLWRASLRRFGSDWASPRLRWQAQRLGLPVEPPEDPLVRTLSAAMGRSKENR